MLFPRKVLGYVGGFSCMSTAFFLAAAGHNAQNRTLKNFWFLGASSAAIFGSYLLHMAACSSRSEESNDAPIAAVAYRRRISIGERTDNNEDDPASADDKEEKIPWESYVQEMYAADNDSNIPPVAIQLPDTDERLI